MFKGVNQRKLSSLLLEAIFIFENEMQRCLMDEHTIQIYTSQKF